MSNQRESKPRILVAEDDPINLDIASRTLTRLGCEIIAADNGATATLLLAAEEFELILMDCEMPQLNGIEATRLIREIEAGRAAQHPDKAKRHTPVIAVTAHSPDEARDKCLAAGMDDFISKPLTRGKLTAMLRQWIGECDGASTEEAGPKSGTSSCASEDQADVLDTTALTSLCGRKDGEGARYIVRLLGRFEESARRQIAMMREKCQGDAGDLWRIAHTLRSSAGVLGANRLASQAAVVERHAKEHGLAGLEPALQKLEKDADEAIAALSVFTRKLDAVPES